MATGTLVFRPSIVTASFNPADERKLEARKTTSQKWWSPIFGFPSDPDYIDSSKKSAEPDAKPAGVKFEPGAFTEEKAKQLRRMTTATSSFHDVMYHSAIAARLASDFSDESAH
ncbi:hypothetical protein F511_17651 [Dorcoceras hygrometricum]|uniref:Uncharacterized protein n=1 Tax=Dorcoceras hygrometricum TaxID=472368 RepID=A0A2Z7AJB7_9LAMI|nr:hypothetical protein F511_17651 [Dorcoceras hygrometricum]